MKLISILLLLFFFLPHGYAGVGVIITRTSPIFKKPNINSPILQTKKKGEEIYIHGNHFKKDRYKDYFEKTNIYFNEDLEKEKTDESDESIYSTEFYLTTDDYGNDGFIPKRYVKLVYNDEREQKKKIKPFKHDPTGINRENLKNENYPYIIRNKFKGGLDVGLLSSPRESYSYTHPIQESDETLNLDTTVYYGFSPPFEWATGLYIGGGVNFNYHKNSVVLTNNNFAEETRIKIAIGPFLSYNLIQNKQYGLHIFMAPYVNLFNQVSVEIFSLNHEREKKYFSTINLSTRFGFGITRFNFLGTASAVAKFFVEIFPPYSLENNDQNTSLKKDEFWPTRKIDSNIETLFGVSIGLLTFK